jgi:putative oxidoreductase
LANAKSLAIEGYRTIFAAMKLLNADIGLLILRLGVGLTMALSHGLGKFQKILAGEWQFADPIGIGAMPSLLLAGSAEFLCALAIALGLLTRLAAIPLVITMGVAVLIVHAEDPFSKKEFALLYLIPFLTLIFTGPGRLSLDEILKRYFSKIKRP